jgi:large subunit ribosomal protein L11
MPETIGVLVEGGKATPGPPLGPALGPTGVNVVQVVQMINEKTKKFDGMKVPVKVIINPKLKTGFDIEVGTPPTTALIMKELGIEKGSGNPKTDKKGNISIDQAKKIAEMKADAVLGKSIRTAVKEVVGTCVSMGVTVDGKDPKEVQKLIKEGGYTEILR